MGWITVSSFYVRVFMCLKATLGVHWITASLPYFLRRLQGNDQRLTTTTMKLCQRTKALAAHQTMNYTSGHIPSLMFMLSCCRTKFAH